MPTLIRMNSLARVLGLLAAPVAQFAVIYMNAAAAPGGDGASWTTALREINKATGHPGDEIWIAAGIYRPIEMRPGVAIYGGFVGTETSRAQPDFADHPTIISGDMLGDDGPDFGHRSDNAAIVVHVTQPMDGAVVLDGFVIRGGNGGYNANSHVETGGGICIEYIGGTSPAFRNCIVEDNQTNGYGGGAFAWSVSGGAPTFDRCTFRNNRAGLGGGAAAGYRGVRPVYRDCAFAGNRATDGGALWDFVGEVTRCTFTDNQATRNGGALCSIAFGYVARDCAFVGNAAQQGGAA